MNIIKLQGEKEKRNGIYYEYDVDVPCLGEGGMGRVFKGFRVVERTGERTPVAIKAIYESIPERVIERARREAAIQLENDNLIRMYGFVESYTKVGSVTKVHNHVVMELLVGVTLEDMLKGITTDQNGMTIPFASELRTQYLEDRNAAVIRIMKPILSGLMALHDKGYIHRDIDPSNIMITIDGKIKLIDFGICKQIISLESVDKSLTVAGVFMGKVNYAAPELILGDVKSQNYTTDIYALGILMYQLCTGHLPFSGTDQEVMAANLRKNLPMKDVRVKGFKDMVKKATDKKQSKRYASVSEMRVDLERVVLGRRADFVEIGIGIAAAVVAVVGVSLFFALRSNDEAPYQPSDSELYSHAMNLIGIPDSLNLGKQLLSELADKQYKPARFSYDSMRIYSGNPDEMKAGFADMALHSAGAEEWFTLFEEGLTYSTKGHFETSIPENRQKLMGIAPDPEKAYELMRKAMAADPTDYKAVYWALTNLIYICVANGEDMINRNEVILRDLYNRFIKLYDGGDESYKDAMLVEGRILYGWGGDILGYNPLKEGHL